MAKFLAVLLLLLLPKVTEAATPSPCAATMPYTFTNGTVADANQVNTNFSTLLACANTNDRMPINQNITFYLSPTGSDASNSCLVSTAPCATAQAALSLLQQFYQFVDCTHVATISYLPGSYNQSTTITGGIPGQCNGNQLLFLGNASAPTTIAVTGAGAGNWVFLCTNGCLATLQGMSFYGATGDGLRVHDHASLFIQNVDFQTTIAAQVHLDRGGVLQVLNNYSVSGGAFNHIWLDGYGSARVFSGETLNPCCTVSGITMTINGSPAFSNAFLKALSGLIDMRNITFVNAGGATGPQCAISNNGILRTNPPGGVLVTPGTPATCTTDHGGVFN